MACKWFKAKSQPKGRIAGWDLFVFEMEKLNARGGKCFFMGSSEKVLSLIKEKAAVVYPEEVIWGPAFKMWHWGWRKIYSFIA